MDGNNKTRIGTGERGSGAGVDDDFVLVSE